MTWIDWLIVVIPTLIVLGLAVYSSRYVKGVVDFLSAGRLCGRYVLLAGDMANGISILAIVMACERQYKVGFSVGIWGAILIPLTMMLALFGFFVYRFRETKALSFGQFIEIRYGSKSLRVFASILRTLAELLAHAIMPAVAGRFFLYYLGFPQYITLFGVQVSVFVLLMVICISMAIFIICCGGTLAIVITDAIQGMICLPLICLFSIYFLYKFNWSTEIAPVLMDRVPGQSFINPYDVLELRDFNLLTLVLGAVTLILHAGSWIGGGASGSAITPHEQKMASIMSKWRGFFSPLLYLLLSVAILVTLNHQNFSKEAREIRSELSARVACDVVSDPVIQAKLIANLAAIPEQKHVIGVDAPLSHEKNLDTIYIDTARQTLEEAGVEDSAFVTQQFKTIYHQTMLGVTMRKILSPGLMGLFCLLAILAMVSTDDSYIFSSVLTIVQDVILPFFKKAPPFWLHALLFRVVAVLIGLMFLFCSCYMAQLDYLELFITIVLSLWLGGCGPMVTFALYGKFGTKQGAWASLLAGMGLSIVALYLQRNWANVVYPFLEEQNWVHPIGTFLETVSAPFNPVIVWTMNPEKFPINSFESYLLTMLATLVIYIAVSYLTSKEKYNLDRLLHRGIYNLDGSPHSKINWSWDNLMRLFAGITDEHTLGDKVISYSLVIYTYAYSFGVCFLLMVIWNFISPWSIEYWGKYFLIVNIIIPACIVAVTSVWFGIGGIFGIISLFRRLHNRVVDQLDNGMVHGGMSLVDEAKFKELEEKQK
ncbi:MAG: hypothetical protein LBM70_01190 [Victivallales bacterium]|jgi:Na+/proline symporter|nr:hypothetical protein [Victivallales bacterium]